MRPGEPLVRWVAAATIILGLAGTGTAALLGTGALAFSVALGAGLGLANLWLLRRLTERLMDGEGQGRTLGLLLFKFLLLVGLFFAITRWLPLDVPGLLGGFSANVLAILAGSLFGPSPSAVTVRVPATAAPSLEERDPGEGVEAARPGGPTGR